MDIRDQHDSPEMPGPGMDVQTRRLACDHEGGSMSDIDTIRERHSGTHSRCCTFWAASDPNDTRCDTSVVLDALDACMSLRSERHRNADICTLEKAAMGADAERLAEALRFYADARNYMSGADTTYGNGPGGQQMQPPRIDRDEGSLAREALRQHEEATR